MVTELIERIDLDVRQTTSVLIAQMKALKDGPERTELVLRCQDLVNIRRAAHDARQRMERAAKAAKERRP